MSSDLFLTALGFAGFGIFRHGRGWIVSGYFRDSHPKLATPSNISRKLRELEVSGELEVQYREGRAY
jgi:hypothetical protein